MADKTNVRFIYEDEPEHTPTSITDEITRYLVLPAIPTDLSINFQHGDFHGAPGNMDHYTIDMIASDHLVIADLTSLRSTSRFLLGARAYKRLPIIYIHEKGYPIPDMPSDFPSVEYSMTNPRPAIATLRDEIRRALSEPREVLPTTTTAPSSTREVRLDLVKRIQEAAGAISDLRINSKTASDAVDSLREIANDLESTEDQKSSSAMQDAAEKVLPVLSRFAKEFSSAKGARIVIAGVIAYVLGGAGFSAIAIYGLTLAFWQGPEAFAKAIDALTKRKK
ncbi:hypothetical protein [Bradyrhizobium japonicum]|uniref:hypothetical protein n=1 Tax=Bradyrhizobium japonicum TaxID=375 RepID=UPI003514D01E